jgi:hypothetical protein
LRATYTKSRCYRSQSPIAEHLLDELLTTRQARFAQGLKCQARTGFIPCMKTLEAHSSRLLEAVSDLAALEKAYSEFIQAVLDSALWSPEYPNRLRIPWRLAGQASVHPTVRHVFGSPGLYLFGSAGGVPLYLGMTRRPLWMRLWRRYLHGPRSQCQLAVDYERQLISHGLEGFPNEVREWYRRSFRSSTVRLEGAIAFTRHGIEGIWFAVLPIPDPTAVRSLERRLIPLANAWNRSRRHPQLLNVQDLRPWSRWPRGGRDSTCCRG